jgi:uncharacterized membrane protein YphA (DoxX/SURF4 family)
LDLLAMLLAMLATVVAPAQRTRADVAIVECVTIQLIAAIVLAGVFGLSATSKSRDKQRTQAAVDALTGSSMPSMTAPVLIAAETLVAVALVLPSTRRLGAIASLILLTMFSVLIIRSLRAGRTPSCFCFGSLTSQPLSTLDVLRNVALSVLAIVTLAT